MSWLSAHEIPQGDLLEARPALPGVEALDDLARVAQVCIARLARGAILNDPAALQRLDAVRVDALVGEAAVVVNLTADLADLAQVVHRVVPPLLDRVPGGLRRQEDLVEKGEVPGEGLRPGCQPGGVVTPGAVAEIARDGDVHKAPFPDALEHVLVINDGCLGQAGRGLHGNDLDETEMAVGSVAELGGVLQAHGDHRRSGVPGVCDDDSREVLRDEVRGHPGHPENLLGLRRAGAGRTLNIDRLEDTALGACSVHRPFHGADDLPPLRQPDRSAAVGVLYRAPVAPGAATVGGDVPGLLEQPEDAGRGGLHVVEGKPDSRGPARHVGEGDARYGHAPQSRAEPGLGRLVAHVAEGAQ